MTRDWTWPAAFVFTVIVAAIVVMFALTDDATMRNQLIDHLDTIVPFVVGTTAGAAAGAAVGFAKGKGNF